MYTIKQLKKMATERMSKVFESVFGYSVFNPYTEREYMIVALVGYYANELLEETSIIGEYKFDITFTEEIQEKETMFNDKFSQLFGESFYQIKNTFQVNVGIVGSNVINKIVMAKNETWIPVRTETKGRKSRFSHNDVWDMLYADIQGMKLSEIAKYFGTSSVIVLQILTGKSYQWASGINEMSF